jgi:hypothetical protein
MTYFQPVRAKMQIRKPPQKIIPEIKTSILQIRLYTHGYIDKMQNSKFLQNIGETTRITTPKPNQH